MSETVSSDEAVRPAPKVSVEGVSKSYGSVAALADISFELASGQFLTILGPSGCGKTTLLRLIAGFIELSTGHIRIDGKPVEAVPPHARSIGMVFQRLALFPHMTVEQNIAFPLRMRRFQPAEIPDRVDHYLTLVRLKGYQKRRISELSGGQQQRVAIARALVFEPALLLLDEPLAALDKKLREEMQLEFRRIQRELGVTTINVTHDQREALVMSDRVLILSDGRMQQFASPTEIYQTPSNRFVADFVGMTNFLRGEILERNGELGVSVHGQFFDAAIPEGPSFVPGRPIECAIRAQHVLLGRSAAQANVQFTAYVEEAIFEGERVLYQLAVPALNGAKLTAVSHREEDGTVLPVGSEVLTGWKKAHILVFPS